MLYIKEIYYRVVFFVFCLLNSFIISYTFRNTLLDFIVLPFIMSNKHFISYFIYTHPIELTKVIFVVVFTFTLCFSLPYLFWSIKDFFRTTINKGHLKKTNSIIFYYSIFTIFFNFSCFLFLFPFMWNFLESFNKNSSLNVSVLLELRIEEYINFIVDYFILINIIICFLYVILITLVYINTSLIIKNKKIYFLLKLVLATALSSPEIIVQLLILFLLVGLFEAGLFLLFFKLKFNKAIN